MLALRGACAKRRAFGCTRYPFGHLMIGQWQQLRAAYGALLKERMARNAPPVRVTPPPVTDTRSGANPLVPVEGACLFCGIGHQSVPAVEVAQQGRQHVARRIWTPKRVGAAQLGGQSSAELSGYLCQSCADAVEHVHSVGPSALERALVVALAPEKLGLLSWGNFRVDGLIGWDVLVAHARQANPPTPDPAHNERGWEHLADISEMPDKLRAALGG